MELKATFIDGERTLTIEQPPAINQKGRRYFRYMRHLRKNALLQKYGLHNIKRAEKLARKYYAAFYKFVQKWKSFVRQVIK